jgi:LysM repeat protein
MGSYRRPPRRPPRRRRCPTGAREYTIRQGDTFNSIANYFNTTVTELRRLNPGINPDRLRPGQVICVPRRGPNGPERPYPPCPWE